MKTLVLSDLHLGSPLFNKRTKVISLLKDSIFKRIILNGDIFDDWEDDFKDIIKKNSFISTTIRELSKEKEVYFIMGNHDPDIDEVRKYFPDLLVVSSLQLKDFFIIHGDEFDELTTKYSWIAKIMFIPHYVCQRLFGINIKAFFRKLTQSLSNKKDTKKYRELVSNVEKEAIDKYSNICNFLIIGHTHFPKIKYYGQCTYINCGDMIDSYTYVEFDDDDNTFVLHGV